VTERGGVESRETDLFQAERITFFTLMTEMTNRTAQIRCKECEELVLALRILEA
jgi:formylmethanofuran dehydrogenase subunit E